MGIGVPGPGMGRRRNATDTAGRSWASLPCVELVPRRPGQTQQAWYRDQSRELLVNVRPSLTVPGTYDVDSRHVRENNRSVPVCITGAMALPAPTRPSMPSSAPTRRPALMPAQPRYANRVREYTGAIPIPPDLPNFPPGTCYDAKFGMIRFPNGQMFIPAKVKPLAPSSGPTAVQRAMYEVRAGSISGTVPMCQSVSHLAGMTRTPNDGGVTFAITQAIAGAALGGLTGFILGRQPLIREREQYDADIKAYKEQIRELEAKLAEGSDASDQADARTGNPTMSLRQMIAMHQHRR